MRRYRWKLAMATVALFVPSWSVLYGQLPQFAVQELDRSLKIGYAVLPQDIDGDEKVDLVVVDQHQIVWYENPGERLKAWPKHLILDGQTKPDNVSVAALDIDGDKAVELIVGSAWKPFDTVQPGQLVWLNRGANPRETWSMHELPCDEPTVHRVKTHDTDGDGVPEIVHVPLMGRGATKEGNWTDGRPLRIVAFKIPKESPERKENWEPFILSNELSVAHNFCTASNRSGELLVASYFGISSVTKSSRGDWSTRLLHPANQSNPSGSRGASEIKQSTDGREQIGTIEPWHGNEVVIYQKILSDTEGDKTGWKRIVLDDHLRWGHGVAFGDLNQDGIDELIIGVRDDPRADQGDKFSERRGIRIYQSDSSGTKWSRTILEDGGVAVEDLAVADLDQDGKLEIVGVGRQTGNLRIYWNLASP